ncbi:MAG: chorismate mutase [Chitinivibrionales bacterium]|nr:chorismate mutase [Chitinivibrionales bacterium]
MHSLQQIAAQLESLEETIIFKLIDRAQFKQNSTVYKAGKSGFAENPDASLFHLRLLYHERMDAQFGRFCVPEERPFNSDLPQPRRSITMRDTGLQIDNYDAVNLTHEIGESYLKLLPRMCRRGDDGHYGSSVEHDVYAVQAIARRIHYGALYVAESKYRGDQDTYAQMIRRNDRCELMQHLTRKEIEERIIDRVREKVAYAQGRINEDLRIKIDPESVLTYYRDYIIPLTKEGEVRYLLQRPSS